MKNLKKNVNIKKERVFTKLAKCCVENCNSKKKFNKNIRFFRFPKEENILEKWKENCKITEKINEWNLVCENHFEKQCLGKRKLKSNAIPTLFSYVPRHNKPFLFEKEKRKRFRKCCIEKCFSNNSLFHLFQFPTDTNKCNEWIQACNLDNKFVTKNKYICEKHFLSSEVKRRKLIKGAIPHITSSYKCDSPILDAQNQSSSSTSSSHNIQSKSDSEKISFTAPPILTKKYERRKGENEQNLLLRRFIKFHEESKIQNDQYYALGQYLVHKLRNLTNEKQKIFAKGLIMQIIQNATLAKLTESSTIAEPAENKTD